MKFNRRKPARPAPVHRAAPQPEPDKSLEAAAATEPPVGAPIATAAPLRLRLAAGLHAVQAAEVEIRALDGARIAGGNGLTEFNLWVETWVDVVVMR